MAGAYTDNQPDFAWMQPYETKTFSQYWYPIQQIGPAKNANTDAAVNLEFDGDAVRVGVCLTARRNMRIVLTRDGKTVLEEQCKLAPGAPFVTSIECFEARPEQFRLTVIDAEGNELIAWQPEALVRVPLLSQRRSRLPPEAIAPADELYLTGLHLEQYRHATRSADAYWREGLKRDPGDARINNAVGLAHLRAGEFALAEQHFARAVGRLTARNPNPRDGEAHYNLGLSLLYQGQPAEAYDAFHKCVWNFAERSAGYYSLASISAEHGDFALALEQIELSLLTNQDNISALALKGALLRHRGRSEEAVTVIKQALILDPLCLRTRAELFLLDRSSQSLKTFLGALEGGVQTLIDVTYDLAWSGLRTDAYFLLHACVEEARFAHPMLWYSLSWLALSLGDEGNARTYAREAQAASSDYCFPARVEEMIVLEAVIQLDPSQSRAYYYLGNLYYDKRRYEEAIRCWRKSIELDDTFSIPFRNLGIAEFNIHRNPEAASQMYARAFGLAPNDARVLYEWDQLRKRAGLCTSAARLRFLEGHLELVARRDDLTIEYITLLNQSQQWKLALEHLAARQFTPWEGGEGLVSAQYVHAHRALGLSALAEKQSEEALRHFEAARHYPHNLGEGKHLLTLERDLDYFSGLATRSLDQNEAAHRFWSTAGAPLGAPGVHAYFQGTALRAMGDEEAACNAFSNLAAYAEQLATMKPVIDYFATSLPNMLLFEDDLDKRNHVDSHLLSALGHDGLGNTEKAVGQLEQVLVEDPNHLFAAELLRWIGIRADLIQRTTEGRTSS